MSLQIKDVQVDDPVYDRMHVRRDLRGKPLRHWGGDPRSRSQGLRRVAQEASDLAAMYDLEFSPHNVCTPVGTMASAHACSTANTLGALEFHFHDFPFWREMTKSKRSPIDRGFIKLSDEPGLGVELDEEVIRRYFPYFEL